MSWHSVRGHDRIVTVLRSNLRNGRFPHALLFVGSRGRRQADVRPDAGPGTPLRAKSRGDAGAVRACPGCVQVEAGTHPDLLEVARPDQRQELPIQVIRDLCAEFGLKPARGARKIAIVDDLDDMNDEAANAFLKTLEEPPPGAVLILIGTSAELQLETIVSRCQVIRFEPLPEPVLAELLLEQRSGPRCRGRRAARGAGRGEREPGDRPGRPGPGAVPPRADRRAGRRARIRSRRCWPTARGLRQAGGQGVGRSARGAPACWWASWRGSSGACSGRPPALEPPCPDPADRRAALALAERLEPEDVFVLADRCLAAAYHLQRNLYMPLVLESLFHDLARLINPRGRG